MLSDLAVKLIVIGAILIAAALGVSRWIAQHDEARDTRLETAANVRTEHAGEVIAAVAEDLSGEQKTAEVGIDNSQKTSGVQYEAARKNPTVRAAADVPVPDGLQELARKRREERDRLDRDAAGGEQDGGSAFARARSWLDSHGRSEDDGERIPARSEP